MAGADSSPREVGAEPGYPAMTSARRRLLERLHAVLHLDDPPWKVALALAVGVFISFTPTYGLQTLLALLVAALARLNKAATVAGAWLNFPWFAPLIYAAGWKLGTLLLADTAGVEGLSVALLTGTTILGAAAGLVTYVVALRLLKRRRAQRAATKRPESRDYNAA
jgi:uncharacterized protein